MPDARVTIKIPRSLYERIKRIAENSSFSSSTDFIVYVLRDLMGDAEAQAAAAAAAAEGPEFTQDELDDVKRKLRNLGYL